MSQPAPSSDVHADGDQPARTGPAGLGGWLILPLLGLVATPVAEMISQWQAVSEFNSYWEMLSIAQKSLVIVEVLVGIVMAVIAPVILLVLAFKRLEVLPGLYILWICSFPVINLLDALATLWIFDGLLGSQDVFDSQFKRDFGQGIVQAFIWSLYMNMSKRVQNTFVN